MKKALVFMVCLALGISLVVACGQKEAPQPAEQQQEQTTQENTAATTTDNTATTEQAQQPAQDTTAAPAANESNVQAATPAQP